MRKITSTITLASLLICTALCGCSGFSASQQPRDSSRKEIDQAKDLNGELRERAERKAYQERLRTGPR